MRLLLTVVALVLAAVGCRSKVPTDPVLILPEIPNGVRGLGLTGFAASNDPTYPPCAPFGVPGGGTSVHTPVVVSRDGEEIVLNLQNLSTGDLQMRFRPTGQIQMGGKAIAGSLRGAAQDTGYAFYGVHDVRLTAVGPNQSAAAIEGTVFQSGYVMGRVRGHFTFSDSHGASGTCEVLSWVLEVVGPPAAP